MTQHATPHTPSQAPARIDLKKEWPQLYKASAKTPALVTVPPLPYLMVDGSGDPNTAPAYAEAITALYSVAYTLKFASKNSPAGIDFTVMPLQGLWWAADMAAYATGTREDWHWTMMILQPEHITAEMVADAIEQTRAKKNPAGLDHVRFATYDEGLAAQVLHVGPYSAEAPTIERLHGWIAAQGYTHIGAGKHHELYLSDPNRTAPEKLKTIIRQPVAAAS